MTHDNLLKKPSQPAFSKTKDSNWYENTTQKCAVIEKNEKPTILIIDDEEMLLDILKIILENNGYKVITAIDGLAGIDSYKANLSAISLVMCDIGLPKLNGIAVYKEIKAIDPNLKIIMVSGLIESNSKEELIKLGAQDFIEKPYFPVELLERIQTILNF